MLGLIIAAIQPLCLKLSQGIIDALEKDSAADGFFRWVPLALIGLFLASGLAKYSYNTLRRYVSEKVILKLREDLFNKYLWLPLSILDQKRSGEMISGLQNDLQQINAGVDTLCDVFKEPFIFLGLIGVAFYWDWQLALSTLVAAPIIVMLFSRSGAAVKRYASRNLEQFSDIMSLGQESLTGARVVRVFHLEKLLSKKFTELQEGYFRTIWKSIRVQELSTPSVEFIGACLMGAVVLYGRYQISNGWLTTGELVAFIFALGLSQMPIKNLNNAYLKLKNAEAAAERIYAVLDLASTQQPKSFKGYRVDHFEKEIRFENVGLHYGDKRALEGINFDVQRGECVAFVGASGGGKSSIINLLPRLYEVTSGKITLDGMDIRNVHLEDLRNLYSYVTQDTFLFNDSIYENIRYGKPSATKAEIEKAAELAHCTGFIAKSPQGFETKIGDRGVCLSGGERQRVAIARSILKGAPILILDEATSNLDSHSESVVQSAIETLMKGKTVFMVAHRFSTLRMAKKIFVLDGGKIIQSGTHESLAKSQGMYEQLHKQQTTPV